jgi:DNA-binding protein HU-beta
MNKPMTKTQLVAALADAMGSDKKTAGAALDALAVVVAREVAAGGSVAVPGLGKVACKARPERQVRNPATGEMLTKPRRQAGEVCHRQGAEGCRERLISGRILPVGPP